MPRWDLCIKALNWEKSGFALWEIRPHKELKYKLGAFNFSIFQEGALTNMEPKKPTALCLQHQATKYCIFELLRHRALPSTQVRRSALIDAWEQDPAIRSGKRF